MLNFPNKIILKCILHEDNITILKNKYKYIEYCVIKLP